MNIQYLTSLTQTLNRIKRDIQDEEKHAYPNELKIARLKKTKLLIKDKIEEFLSYEQSAAVN